MRAYGPSLVLTRVIEVATPGRYHFWTSAPAFSLGSCDQTIVDEAPARYVPADAEIPPRWALESKGFAGYRVHVVELPAGRVELSLTTTWDELEQRIVVAPVDPALPVAVD